MQLFTTLFTFVLSLLTSVRAWPLGLYYDDVCNLRARSVWRTPVLDTCHVMTNVAGPSFIAVNGTVGDGLAWDKDYELCLYDTKPDCLANRFINCFTVGKESCTRLHAGTHVIKFQAIPTNHTNVLITQGGSGQQ